MRKKYAQELVASAEKMRQDAEKEDEGSEKRDELEKKVHPFFLLGGGYRLKWRVALRALFV